MPTDIEQRSDEELLSAHIDGDSSAFPELMEIRKINKKGEPYTEKEIERKPNKEEENRKIISEIKKEVRKKVSNQVLWTVHTGFPYLYYTYIRLLYI